MNIGYYIFIFVILIIARYLFFRLNKVLWAYLSGAPCGDAATYFFLIQFFRKKSCDMPDERCLLSDEPVLVPTLFMKAVGSVFSDEILLKKSWIPNFLLYIVGLFFFMIACSIRESEYAVLFPFMLLLFIFQPDNISIDSRRVHYTVLQPRYLGLLANSAFWFIFVFFGIHWWSFIAISVLVTISLNTSIFCRQATFLSILLTSLFLLDGYLFLSLILAFAISAVLFKKEFIPSIMPQVRYSYHYYLKYYKPGPSSNLIIHFLKNLFSRPMYESYPYFGSFIVAFLATISFFYNKTSHISSLLDHDLMRRLCFLYIATLIIFIITGFRKYAFLGECWRYFSFNTYFLTPFFLPSLIHSLSITWRVQTIIFVGIILMYAAIAFFTSKDNLENKNSYLIELLKKNSDSFKDAVWYGIPYRISTTAVTLGFGIKTFEYQYISYARRIHNTYFSDYPFLKWNEHILKDNMISHVLVENAFYEKAVQISGFSTSGLTLLAANDAFSIYKI